MIRAREVSRESPAGIETRPPPDAQRHAVHPRLSPARLRRKPFVAYASFGIRPYGIKAIPRCRSRNRLIGRELSIEYAALESGLSRFVHLDKGNFVKRDALIARQQKGFKNCFVTLEMVGIIEPMRAARNRSTTMVALSVALQTADTVGESESLGAGNG